MSSSIASFFASFVSNADADESQKATAADAEVNTEDSPKKEPAENKEEETEEKPEEKEAKPEEEEEEEPEDVRVLLFLIYSVGTLPSEWMDAAGTGRTNTNGMLMLRSLCRYTPPSARNASRRPSAPR
jgi:hypothetical protein